jgi:hypothetical protein
MSENKLGPTLSSKDMAMAAERSRNAYIGGGNTIATFTPLQAARGGVNSAGSALKRSASARSPSTATASSNRRVSQNPTFSKQDYTASALKR